MKILAVFTMRFEKSGLGYSIPCQIEDLRPRRRLTVWVGVCAKRIRFTAGLQQQPSSLFNQPYYHSRLLSLHVNTYCTVYTQQQLFILYSRKKQIFKRATQQPRGRWRSTALPDYTPHGSLCQVFKRWAPASFSALTRPHVKDGEGIQLMLDAVLGIQKKNTRRRMKRPK